MRPSVKIVRPSVKIVISKKIRFYKAVQNFPKKIFFVNLLINKVYYVYIDLHKQSYIPNQAIRIAKLCFHCYLLNRFSTNIPYIEHHFHELILAQWGLIFGIINALLHSIYIKLY